MFLLKKFLGEEYDRINTIIDSFNNMQNNYINLEACVSYPFPSVLKAQSCPMFLLPTEGMVNNRYFPNFPSMDDVDIYTEELVLKLLNLENNAYGVCNQPHSGTQANQCVYNAILKDNDIILSLDPKSGGHISHNKFNKKIKVINYGLTCDNIIDYQQIKELANKYKPKLIIAGASSYPNDINFKIIGKIAKENNSLFMVDACHTILYILGNNFSTPFPYVDFLTFSFEKVLKGPQGGLLIYRKKFEKDISYSIFPKTQGGPLQSIQFAKLLCLVELNKMNIDKYSLQIQKTAYIMNEVFRKNEIKTYCSDHKTHIILIDVTQFNLTGQEAEKLLYDYKILVNKNQIPNDHLPPHIASGIRFGVTCIENLKYSEEDIRLLASIIIQLLKSKKVDSTKISYLINKYHN